MLSSLNVFDTYASPLGTLRLGANEDGVNLIEYTDENVPESKNGTENRHISKLKKELRLYFNGSLRRFSVPLVLSGTPFQKLVWKELTKIPYGSTISYLELAKRVGNKKAVRAVAQANSRNKIAIIVPCHRVIASGGTLGGYSGGLWRKEYLLKLEQISESI